MSESVSAPTKKRSYLLNGIAAFVAMLLVVGAVLIALHWPFTQQRVTQALEKSFPVSVTFSKFSPTYFPHPGFEGEGAVVKRLSRPEGTPPVVTVAQFRLEANYIDLFVRPGYLAKLVVKGLHVQVPPVGTPHASSGWVQSESGVRIGTVIADGALLEIARADGKEPLKFDLHKVKLTSVGRSERLAYDVAFHNPLPPGDISANGHFGPWNSGAPGQTPLDGHYVFENGDLGVFGGISGIFRAADKFEGVLQHIETHAKIDVPDFRVHGARQSVHLTSEFNALVNGTNGDVALEKVHSQFLQTAMETSGKIEGHEGQNGKTAELDFYVTNGRIQDVLTLFVTGRRAPLNGNTSFRAHVVLPPGPGKFLEKVRLAGDFGIDNGDFNKPSTREKLNTFSERALGHNPAADPDSDPATNIAKLAGHVELRQATANLTDITFEVPGATTRLDGTYNLETAKIDLHGTLKTQADLSQDSGGGVTSVLLKPFNGLFRKKHAGAVVPVHLTGTYRHPEVGLDMPGKQKGKAPPLWQAPSPSTSKTRSSSANDKTAHVASAP